MRRTQSYDHDHLRQRRKLTADEVCDLRQMHFHEPSLSWEELGRMFRIGGKHAYRICTGMYRRDAPGPIDEIVDADKFVRCPTCGGKVLMPCQLCALRSGKSPE